MASGMVRAAISSFVTESNFSNGSDHWKKRGDRLSTGVISDDIRLTEFDSFTEALLQLLEKHMDTACAGCIHSRSVVKEKAWILSTS